MSRLALLILLITGGPLLAQEEQPADLASLRKEVQALNEQTRQVEEETAAAAKQKADREEVLENDVEDRLGAERAYAAGEGLAAGAANDRIAALENRKRNLELRQADINQRLRETDADLEAVRDTAKKLEAELDAARKRDTDSESSRKGLWAKVEGDLKAALGGLRKALRGRDTALRDLQDVETKTGLEYAKALAMHKRENLFRRSGGPITAEKVVAALSDLHELPRWSRESWASVTSYFSAPEHRPGILTWAGSAIVLTLLFCFLARAMRKRSIRMEQARADSESEIHARAAVHTAFRFGRRAVHVAILVLVPWSAAVMLPGLSARVETFLIGVAQLSALYYAVWAVYREVLRPESPEQAILKVEAPIRRLAFLALCILFVTTVPARVMLLALHAADFQNETAYLLLELLRLVGASLAFSGIIFRKRIFAALLPPAHAAWARVARAIALFARPFLQALLPVLLVLQALRYENLAELLGSFSLSLLIVVVTGVLGYHLLRSLALQRIEKRYGDTPHSEAADAARGALLFALRVTVFLVGLWCVPLFAGISLLEFRESLQIGLPFMGSDSNFTLWNIGAAVVTGLIVWFGTFHAKALLQHQILARTGIDVATQYTVATLFGYVVLTIGLVVALHQVTDLSALGTIVAALSVGIGFGMQDIVSNFISGIILLFERPIRVGDTIEVGANRGRVRTINIRATTVQTLDNIFILVPNRALISSEVVNYGYDDPKIRMKIPVGVSYSSDAEQVRDVLLKVADERSGILKHPIPQVQFVEFGDSSLNFILLAWIQRADQRSRITSDLNFAIFAAFREAHIEIPFPQRDLHIRSAEGLPAAGLPTSADEAKPEPEA